jgi:GWxTD domain-containing protein
MSLIESWVQTPAATALVWTLLHSLWEGALAAVLLAAALLRLRGARARYAAACIALLVLLAGFAVTFATLVSREQGRSVHSTPIRLGPIELEPGASSWLNEARSAVGYLPWLAPVWMAGVLLFHLRSLAGWLGARRLRRSGVCCPPAPWQQRLESLAARVRIAAPVVLFESALAEVPLVIGFVRPVILMPVGLLAGLPAAQVEALLVHELAHIRRYDYLVNLLQVFVEGLLFYHPAAWWVSAVIRAEREHCCDDLVVAIQGEPYQYATALAALEFHRGEAGQPVLAATGGSLAKRIRRLLAQPETPRSALAPVLSAAILVLTGAAMLAAWQTKPPALPQVRKPGSDTPYAKLLQEDVANITNDAYAHWLKEDVAYIITEQERTAFKALQSDPEREHFIEQFWLRRDPTPGTPDNEFKEEHYRRIAYANRSFTTAAGLPGWKTDRGRIYITYGPPDEKESHPSGGSYRRPAEQGGGTTTTFPFEQWLYRYIDGVGTNVIVEFVDTAMNGEYRMTMDPSEKDALLHVPGAAELQARASVQALGGTAVISVPLRAYRALRSATADRRVVISGRIVKDDRVVATFTDTVETPDSTYIKKIPLAMGAAGTYRLELTLQDSSGHTVPESVDFEVR